MSLLLMSRRPILLCAAMLISSVASVFADTNLVMVEERGCVWCARWNDEVSHKYPKTDVGKAAPLKRLDIDDARPADIIFARSLFYTPTFVLVIDGREVSRIEGYPGEDFFWGLLEQMLNTANVEVNG